MNIVLSAETNKPWSASVLWKSSFLKKFKKVWYQICRAYFRPYKAFLRKQTWVCTIFKHSWLHDIYLFIKKSIKKGGNNIHLTNPIASFSRHTHYTFPWHKLDNQSKCLSIIKPFLLFIPVCYLLSFEFQDFALSIFLDLENLAIS